MAHSSTASIVSVAPATPPPGLQEATKNSTVAWQEDLEALFRHAKDRFPDVVWELVGDENDPYANVEEVWGHKAIVYARAPPSFQTRYFSFRPNGVTSPSPYPSSPSGFNYPVESALSLGMESSLNLVRHQDPNRTPSPSPSTVVVQNGPTSTLRLTTSLNPALFSNELEYLYTGKGFGEAFEFLFDSSERAPGGLIESGEGDDAESLRIDKLRKDLVFMWRSRLYSDVRIALTGNFGGSGHHESTTAIFSSHRFILVSRSSYFHTALLAWPVHKNATNEPPTLTLPSPPFTPASLHFTLGFIYTGTLIFSHRTYDLSTAFAILKAALYLELSTLHDEVQARIVQEMCHGLFHAFIPFAEYESLTGGKWGTGGCRCRQCARRAPRVLEFSLEEDVRNPNLERGARRALVGLFGEGWCTQEFASLSPKLRDSILRGLGKRTTPQNVFPLLFAAEHALSKLGSVIEPWGDTVREMVLQARRGMDELICKESEACFNADEWMEIMENNGVRFEDGERVEWVMAAVMRGLKEASAPSLYQTLVSSILLRPHPNDTNEPFLPTTSHIHVQVEQVRIELLKWIGKRWLDIRQQNGFDPLEDWTLKEISDHIEVPVDDLLSPPSYSSPKNSNKGPSHMLRPISNHPHTSKADAGSEAASSMRASVLSRSLHMRQGNASSASVAASGSGSTSHGRGDRRDRSDRSSTTASSIHSVRTARSSVSVSSAGSSSTVSAVPRHRAGDGNGDSPARRLASDVRASQLKMEMRDRPDSKLTPSPRMQPSIIEPDQEDEEREREDMDEQEDESVRGDGDSVMEQSVTETEDSRASTTESVYHTPTGPPQRRLISRTSVSSVSSRASVRTTSGQPGNARQKLLAPSVKSTTPPRKPATSSIRTSPTTTRPNSRGSVHSTATGTGRTRLTSKPSPSSRPSSRLSATSTRSVSTASALTSAESTGTYKTASTGGLSTPTGVRSRKTSAASTVSVRTAGGGRSAAGSPVEQRKRRISGASVSSVASNTGSVRSVTAGAKRVGATPVKRAPSLPVAGAVDPTKLSPASAGRTPRSPAMQTSFSAGAIGGKAGSALSTTTPTAGRKVVVPKKSAESVRSRVNSKVGDAAKKVEEVKKAPVPARSTSGSPKTPAQSPTTSSPPKSSVEPSPSSAASTPASETPPALPEKDVVDVPVPAMKDADKENVVPSASLLLSAPPPPSSSASSDSSTSTATVTPPDALTNTASTITIKPKVHHPDVVSEHKKTSSAASISSIATLKKKSSTDTIKTVKSSGLSISSDNKPESVASSDNTPKSMVTAPMSPALPPVPSTSVPSSPAQLTFTPSPLSIPHHHHSRQPTTSIDSVLASDKPPGATLEIGIPCIISSKRKRFKAYARYIGEVIGEKGPWVGVEVPMNDNWGDAYGTDRTMKDDRQWNDGSWGGIRYFEIGGMGSEWGDYGSGSGMFEDRAARRRRVDGGSGSLSGSGVLSREGSSTRIGLLSSLKRDREGDALSIASSDRERMKRMRSASPAVSDMSGTGESMGLFVRPQQVLYVVDAVGTDL
ncbi:hypothetical protein CPC08DRAFT_226217 [Agrocybe pediades]|nr:hypothetical protein CPC08DRAFT_226217 [Agrocybe pediades]